MPNWQVHIGSMSRAPQARSQTVRLALLAQLRGGELGAVTALELSGRVGIPERDVAEHLEHLSRSLRQSGERLRIEPAECLGCGFVFRKRDRLTRPGACPSCRGTRIESPRFWIEAPEAE